MEIIQNKDKRIGLIGTIVFHLLLLLLFLLYGLTYTTPKPESGVLINFGTTDAGSGEMQPITNEKVEITDPPPTDPVTPQEQTPTNTAEEDVLTQKNEETIAIKVAEETQRKKELASKEMIRKKAEEEAKIKREADEAIKKKEEEAKQKAQSFWDKVNSNKSSGEGNTNQKGDQGKKEGTPDGNAYDGTPGNGGNGVSFVLKGRNMVSIPKIIDTSQDEGKVVVDIIVNRNGQITKATPGAKGSTTTSAHLFRKAKEAALKTKFSANPNAPEEQIGKMTFIFILE